MTFLPLSATQTVTLNLLVLRNTLINGSFANSVQSVPAGTPTGAGFAMGPYFPHTSVCVLSTLTTSGPHACGAGQ